MQRFGAVLQRRDHRACASRRPLAPRKPVGPPQIVQTHRRRFHRMDRHQSLQQHLRQPGTNLRPSGQLRRQMLADHQPWAVLDDLELLPR